jgi:hypothetical protein
MESSLFRFDRNGSAASGERDSTLRIDGEL